VGWNGGKFQWDLRNQCGSGQTAPGRENGELTPWSGEGKGGGMEGRGISSIAISKESKKWVRHLSKGRVGEQSGASSPHEEGI